jgi:hypothetical protein
VLFRRHPAVAVPCGDTGAAADVDTPQDLAELESRAALLENFRMEK